MILESSASCLKTHLPQGRYLVDSQFGNFTQALIKVNDMVSGSKFSILIILCVTVFFESLLTGPLSANEKGEQVTCEVTILEATPEVAKRLIAPWHVDAFVENGTELATTDIPEIKDNAASTSSSIHFDSTARSCPVKLSEYQRMLKILRNTKGCSVSAGPRVTTSGNEMVAGFAGTVRQYQVSAKQRRAKFGTVVSVPEYQVFEDGIIAEHQATVTNGHVALKSKVVINEITNVDSFTFDGPKKPISLYLVSTQTRELNIAANLEPDEVLLVSSEYDGSIVEPRLANWGPYQNSQPYFRPFISQLASPKPKALYYVISAVR